MSKQHLHTTLSSKHIALLETLTEKYGTKQKTLEYALELLDAGSLIKLPLSEEDRLWLLIGRDLRPMLVIFQKEYFIGLIERDDIEIFRDYILTKKPTEFAIQYYYQKPLKNCSLQEVIDGIILNIKIGNLAENITCKDNGDHFEVYIGHSLGINGSNMLAIMNESVLNSYGVRCETEFSEKTIFHRIYKK